MPLSVYSTGEDRAMHLWQRSKDGALAPLILLLLSFHVSPLMVSVSGVLVALFAAFLGVALDSLWYLVLGLWLHIIFDALDGALARKQGGGVEAMGVLTDVCADFLVVVITSGFLAYVYPFDAVLPLVFSSFYGVVLACALAASAMGKPLKWCIRPRLILYAVLTVDAVWATSLTMPTLFVLTCILGLEFLFAVFTLARASGKP